MSGNVSLGRHGAVRHRTARQCASITPNTRRRYICRQGDGDWGKGGGVGIGIGIGEGIGNEIVTLSIDYAKLHSCPRERAHSFRHVKDPGRSEYLREYLFRGITEVSRRGGRVPLTEILTVASKCSTGSCLSNFNKRISSNSSN